jgi:hypothetical protein
LDFDDAMAQEDFRQVHKDEAAGSSEDEEARSLLSASDGSDTVEYQGHLENTNKLLAPHSSNHVHFQDEDDASNGGQENGHANWTDEEDFLAEEPGGLGRSSHGWPSDGGRVPLLTDIEAPSVTVAGIDRDFDAEDLLESARPKSGMRNAFMNMANSIM